MRRNISHFQHIRHTNKSECGYIYLITNNDIRKFDNFLIIQNYVPTRISLTVLFIYTVSSTNIGTLGKYEQR